MSLWESGDSTGEVSLKEIFDGKEQIEGLSGLDLERVAFVSCRGGWPLAVDMDDEIALDQAFDYLNAVEQRDIQQADGVDRDPSRVHRLLRSYARHQGAQANYSTIRADLVANEGDSLDEDTIASYIKALKSIFVVEDVEAWNLTCVQRQLSAHQIHDISQTPLLQQQHSVWGLQTSYQI